jgi:hypothetical protein
MPRLEPATHSGSQYMDHRKEITGKWREFDTFLRFSGLLDVDLKEEVRRAIAQHGGCKMCASLGEPQSSYKDPRMAAAVRFGSAVAQSPNKGVPDEVFDDVRAHFDAAEIVELSCWVSFVYGAEIFGGIMQLDPAPDAVKKMYVEWIAQGKRQHLRQTQ